MRWKFKVGEEFREVELTSIVGDTFTFRVDGELVTLRLSHSDTNSLSTDRGELSFEHWSERRWRGVSANRVWEIEPVNLEKKLGEGASEIRTQMPGRILKVLVEAEQNIEAEQPLFVIEAMKMENEIRSPAVCRVKEVLVKPGDSVESGALLVRLDAAQAD